MFQVTVRADALILRLEGIKNLQLLREPMRDSLDLLRNEASKFPPQPSRTRARTFNTWVREVGRLPKSAFVLPKGGLRKRFVTKRILKPSEKLLANWKRANPTILVGSSLITGQLRNPVSYGAFVQGEKQAGFHRQTGWRTTRDLYRQFGTRIAELFASAILQRFR